jgi:hypothetical protein
MPTYTYQGKIVLTPQQKQRIERLESAGIQVTVEGHKHDGILVLTKHPSNRFGSHKVIEPNGKIYTVDD